jgi:SAM-dependent methyltransferase
MSVFGKYSRYYDLLYKDKDYVGETEFIAGLIKRYQPDARSLLELGCGSGIHASLLAEKGYTVDGIDFSQDMLDAAQLRLKKLPAATAKQLRFSHGDVRSARLGKKFDCVLSLFHVVSYQPTNADLKATFATAREHMQPGGIFVFDCWYGPAVLTERPATRTKHMQDEVIEVRRLAEPVLYPNENLVDVNYHVFIRDRASGTVEEVKETHRMRFLFKPEIELLAESAGMKVEHACEWMTSKAPGTDTWGVCFILRA